MNNTIVNNKIAYFNETKVIKVADSLNECALDDPLNERWSYKSTLNSEMSFITIYDEDNKFIDYL